MTSALIACSYSFSRDSQQLDWYREQRWWSKAEVETRELRAEGENLLEGEDAQRSVGLVARVVRHPLAPEVVAEDVSEAGARPNVRVVDDSPHIVVHQLPAERVAVAQGTEGGQHGVATRSPHRLRPDGDTRLQTDFLLPSRCCHVGPGFSRGSAWLRMKAAALEDTSIPPGR